MRYYLLDLLILSAALAGCSGNDRDDSLYSPGVKMIGFSVRYPEGWSAHTYFYSNLKVQGGHISGGEKPVVHLVEDNLPEELWKLLYEAAEKIKDEEIQSVIIDSTEPVYKIYISYDNGETYAFETHVGQEYNDESLDDLAYLLQKNERIYSHQKGKEWIYK
ncbi:MAG: hypothetical protein JSV99_09440 [Planctomycetota bacterium]|nr:MAG: hypothetical protein JSV99_09440 [Planctomycetota bacterium]